MNQEHPVLDAEWFERFMLISDTQDFEWMKEFVKLSQKEKARFLQGDIENPRFKCKFAGDTAEAIRVCEQLEKDILDNESNEAVKNLYYAKIANQKNRLHMYEDTRDGNDDAFFEKSTALYGKPKKRYFAYVAKRMQELLQSVDHAPQAQERLAQIFSKLDTTKAIITADVLPPPVADNTPALSAESIGEIFRDTLDRYEISGWTVEIDSSGSRSRFSVNPVKRLVFVPGDEALAKRKFTLTEVSVKAIAEHEVGVHARRAFNGSNQSLKLLSFGLANYLVGEEGLASYSQQQIEGATEFYGFDRYLAASLAVGMDGEARDFRAVFSLMCDYYLLTLEPDYRSSEQIANAAWEVCSRIFRGTSGGGVGTIFTRDISYFEGNIKLWEFLTNYPHAFETLFIGKFDPTNQEHVDNLRSLNILPVW